MSHTKQSMAQIAAKMAVSGYKGNANDLLQQAENLHNFWVTQIWQGRKQFNNITDPTAAPEFVTPLDTTGMTDEELLVLAEDGIKRELMAAGRDLGLSNELARSILNEVWSKPQTK